MFTNNSMTHVAYINTGDERWSIDDAINFVVKHTGEMPLAITAGNFTDTRQDVPWFHSVKTLYIMRVLFNPSISNSDALQKLYSSDLSAQLRDETKAKATTFKQSQMSGPWTMYKFPCPVKTLKAKEVTRTLGTQDYAHTIQPPDWDRYTATAISKGRTPSYGPLHLQTDEIQKQAQRRSNQKEKMQELHLLTSEEAQATAVQKAGVSQLEILKLAALGQQKTNTEMALKAEGKTEEEIQKMRKRAERMQPAVVTVIANTKAFPPSFNATSIQDPTEIQIVIRDPAAGLDDIIEALNKNESIKRKVGRGTNASFTIQYKANNLITSVSSLYKKKTR